MMTEITAANFDAEVKNSPQPVLLDFWAAWCGPCRMLSPVVEALSDKYAGTVRFGKVNVDEQPSLAAAYGIQGIPTLILFKNGEPVKTSVGVVPAEAVEDLLR